MKRKHKKKVSGPSKWLQFALARIVFGALKYLPVEVAYRLGRGVGWLIWKCFSGRRAIVKRNLKVIRAWQEAQGQAVSAETLGEDVKEVFQRNTGNLIAGFSFARLSIEQLEERIELEEIDCLSEALDEGQGVIVLLAHMGPWEILNIMNQLAHRHGIEASFGALYRPLDNVYLDRWIRDSRERTGTTLFSRREGFHRPAAFIRDGGALGILADQRTGRGDYSDFFDVPCRTTPLPGLMHRRTGAPIVSVAIITTGPARYTIRFQRVELPKPGSLASADLRPRLSGICNQALEQSLNLSPLDGFWLHDRFRNASWLSSQ